MFFTQVRANGTIQKMKKNPKAEQFIRFKSELLETIGKLINSCKSLQSLVLDAKDYKDASEWEPLLKALEKNAAINILPSSPMSKMPARSE